MEVYSIFAEIDIEGTLINDYYSIQISQQFNQHHSFTVRLPHEVFETKGTFSLNKSKSLIGKVVLINIYRGSKNKVSNEFKGIICNVSIEQYASDQSNIVISGYSPTILLENNPNITCFSQKNLQKICEDVTNPHGSDCRMQINPVFKNKLTYLTQYKESDFEFLNRLSAEFGEWFYYDGKKIYFGKPGSLKEIDLISGEDVYSLQLRLQMLPLTIKATSYQSKTNTVLTDTTPSGINGLGQYAKIAAQESDKVYTVVTNASIRPRAENKADLQSFLKAKKSALAADLEVISGTSLNPEITLGSIATIFKSEKTDSGFSKNEQGKYLITSVTHDFTEHGKYINRFEGIPSTMEVLPIKHSRRPVAETQLAVVTSNDDPDKLGRIKVKMMWQENNVTTDWLRVLTPNAGTGGKTGKNRGMVFIPEVNDEVLVGFRSSDPDRPFVMGSLFHGKSAEGGGKENKIKTLSTTSGNTITLNDDKGSVLLEDAKGNSVLMDGAGKINVTCSEQIELKTGDSSITLKKDGTILIIGKMKVEVKSDQDVKIEGTNIDVKAKANLDLAANASLSAKAKANLALEGTAMAKLSSSAMAEITAALVKIN